MSQISAKGGFAHDDPHAPGAGHFSSPLLAEANISPDPARARTLSLGLLLVGGVGLGATVTGAFILHPLGLKQALAAYHIGVLTCLAMSLGALFWTMIFHLTMSSFSVTVRRQLENIAMMVPWCVAMLIPTLVIELWNKGVLFVWLNPEVRQYDVVLAKKAAYLDPTFFVIRAIIYFFIWTFLAWRLRSYSVEQDRTGNRWLSNKARFTSAWGMPLFALSTAFAAFDWIMSLDYRFFSTMWGVYFFAGATFCSIPLLVLVLAQIKGRGKLEGVVTEEHVHDLAKLMFGFMVFWAYIGFSQYFLIWYSNIPEETAYFNARKTGGWEYLSMFLCFGHFVLPWLILLWRAPRRNIKVLAVLAAWAILMEVLDMYWMVRPMVFSNMIEFPDRIQAGRIWLDAAGIIGALALFAGILIRKVHSGVLIPIRDPRLPESLAHKNYV